MLPQRGSEAEQDGGKDKAAAPVGRARANQRRDRACSATGLPVSPLFVSSKMTSSFEYNKAQDFIWDTYLKASKDEDEARPKNWEGSTTGILTFVRLLGSAP